MEDVAQTKHRLIREAVQDNLPRGPHSKIRIARVPRRRRLWLPAVLLVVIFGCLVSAAVVYRTDVESPVQLVSIERGGALFDVRTSLAGIRDLPIELPEKPPAAFNRAMFPLSIRKIVIDPGHGGEQVGAVSRSGVQEKNITLAVALHLRELLKQNLFDVLMTREADETVTLDKRAEFANGSHADLFVSIHVNWVPVRKLHLLETYFLGPTDDPQATQLVAMENRDSGYSLSEYRHLLEKTYLDARRDESRRLAKAVQAELYRSVHRVNPAVEDRGVKMAPFVVLIRTDMPAILVEVACMSNEDEVKLLSNEDYQQNIAQALLSGIQSYANDLKASKENKIKNATTD